MRGRNTSSAGCGRQSFPKGKPQPVDKVDRLAKEEGASSANCRKIRARPCRTRIICIGSDFFQQRLRDRMRQRVYLAESALTYRKARLGGVHAPACGLKMKGAAAPSGIPEEVYPFMAVCSFPFRGRLCVRWGSFINRVWAADYLYGDEKSSLPAGGGSFGGITACRGRGRAFCGPWTSS